MVSSTGGNSEIKKSTRASLANTMKKLTYVPRLHQQKEEKNKVILGKFGPGRVFGEVAYVVQ